MLIVSFLDYPAHQAADVFCICAISLPSMPFIMCELTMVCPQLKSEMASRIGGGSECTTG